MKIIDKIGYTKGLKFGWISNILLDDKGEIYISKTTGDGKPLEAIQEIKDGKIVYDLKGSNEKGAKWKSGGGFL